MAGGPGGTAGGPGGTAGGPGGTAGWPGGTAGWPGGTAGGPAGGPSASGPCTPGAGPPRGAGPVAEKMKDSPKRYSQILNLLDMNVCSRLGYQYVCSLRNYFVT